MFQSGNTRVVRNASFAWCPEEPSEERDGAMMSVRSEP